MENTKNAIQLHNSPDYDERAKEYDFFNDLYEGDNATMRMEVYLPKHQLEANSDVEGSSDIRSVREKLTRYTNFPKRAFRRYKTIIFKVEPQFDEEATKFLEDKGLDKNIDGKGTAIIPFIKNELFKNKFIYGDSFLLTFAEEDKKPMWESLNPISVKDHSVKNGKVILFRYEYDVTESRNRSTSKPTVNTYSDEYFLENSVVYRARYKKIKSESKNQEESKAQWIPVGEEEKIENFDEIPVAFCTGDSFIDEPSNDILDYHNLKSALMNQLYHQAFDRIIIAGDVQEDQQFALAAFTVNIVRQKEGQPNPTVNNIPPSDTTPIKSQLSESAEQIFKAFFHYQRSINADSKNTESAESQELAKSDFMSVLKTEIEDLERQVNQGLQHLAAQAGVKNFKGEVKFNDTIEIKDVVQELNEELAYYGLIQGRFETWTKELLKRGARRQNLENEDEVIAEIEADKPKEEKVETGLVNIGLDTETDE